MRSAYWNNEILHGLCSLAASEFIQAFRNATRCGIAAGVI